ncbi:MAG: hypothetical protein CVT71_02810 [Alphaproteobacteria bacterium HGW-Alphaproteobacteria-10]|nr:MAG: hypothetical protein CVT71_02810 [Alphaproteobacteria bacterium HGW-Alphaproteobacteria-10]
MDRGGRRGRTGPARLRPARRVRTGAGPAGRRRAHPGGGARDGGRRTRRGRALRPGRAGRGAGPARPRHVPLVPVPRSLRRGPGESTTAASAHAHVPALAGTRLPRPGQAGGEVGRVVGI